MGAQLSPLSLAKRLISFNTINPPGQERKCARYLGKILEDGGFKTFFHEFAEGRTSLVASVGLNKSRPALCLTGHTDTIPLGAVPWSRNPFNAEIDGGRIYGRGSSDMKGGIAAMIVAALEVGGKPGGSSGIILVITAGEETGCQGAFHLAGLGDVLGRAGAVVVGEPTSNYPVVGHKGALWIKARTTGIAAHGSMPDQGVNAIYKAAEAVIKLKAYDFKFPEHPLLGAPTLNVGTIFGGVNINSVPDEATIGIDIRTVSGQTNTRVLEDIKSWLGEDVAFERVIDVGSVSTDPENEWIQGVYDIAKPFLRERPVPRGVTYFTDASVLKPAFGNPPTVILGPGEPTMAHKRDEFCHISKIEEATEIYLEIARRWCYS
jgi:succinyl-diaminopimelate desuccinylase